MPRLCTRLAAAVSFLHGCLSICCFPPCRASGLLPWWLWLLARWPTPPSSPAYCWPFPGCFDCRFVPLPHAWRMSQAGVPIDKKASRSWRAVGQLSLACVRDCCGRCCGRSSSSSRYRGGEDEEAGVDSASLLPRPSSQASPSHLTSVRASWSYRYISFMESFPAVVIGGMLAARYGTGCWYGCV